VVADLGLVKSHVPYPTGRLSSSFVLTFCRPTVAAVNEYAPGQQTDETSVHAHQLVRNPNHASAQICQVDLRRSGSTGHCGLHHPCRWLGSVPMIPRFAAYAVSLLAVVFLISACASRDEAVVEESTAAPSAPMHGRPVYTPGAEGMNASHQMGGGGNGVTPY